MDVPSSCGISQGAFPQFIPSTRHCHRTISTPVHGVFSLEKPMRNVKRAGIIPFMPTANGQTCQRLTGPYATYFDDYKMTNQ